MGLAASQARYSLLTSRKNELEFEGQQINQQRTTLANQQSLLIQNANEAALQNPNSAEYASLSLEIQQTQSADRSLELQLRRVDTLHSAVQTELESIKKVIDKNIELTFKTFA